MGWVGLSFTLTSADIFFNSRVISGRIRSSIRLTAAVIFLGLASFWVRSDIGLTAAGIFSGLGSFQVRSEYQVDGRWCILMSSDFGSGWVSGCSGRVGFGSHDFRIISGFGSFGFRSPGRLRVIRFMDHLGFGSFGFE